jgi:hypothetical protein
LSFKALVQEKLFPRNALLDALHVLHALHV